MVAQHIKSQDLVITTAQIPGRPAPRLVSRAMVESMRPGAVLVDLAVDSGGNVEGSRIGEVVDVRGVKIVGHANLPSRLAPATSALYARNLLNFMDLLIDRDSGRCYDESSDGTFTATTDAWPSEHGYTQGGEPIGRYLCNVDGPSITWTDDALYILAVATSPTGDSDRLVSFWTSEAGPIP